jgi:hypothetical protein
VLTGPGIANLDFALARNVNFRKEGHRLQIRAEVFNMFNHPLFDLPNHVMGNATFGEILSANAYGNRPPRQIQLGMKYVF